MNYVPLIVEEFRKCAAQKILLVDDAYDPPGFPREGAGELLELVEQDDFLELVGGEDLTPEVITNAKNALIDDPNDSTDVDLVYRSLYSAWSRDRNSKLDVDTHFADTKAAALEKLDGLTALLGRCENLEIRFAGADDAEQVFKAFKPDILFMDYFLSGNNQGPATTDVDRSEQDEQRSIKLVKSLLRANPEARPSVVLMSSEDMKDRAEDYRGKIDEMVLALRFGFLHKNEVRQADELKIEDPAADILLDTAQGFEFGRELDRSLGKWRKGAEEALASLDRELHDLDSRDFAYLLRFRLRGEGQSFADYLEWFLGESLRGAVDDTVSWNSDCFARIDDPATYAAIEGGHPYPSDRIARLYHRLRFSMPNDRPRTRFTTGDVFVNSDGTKIRAVLSPDCDLVPRKDGKPSSPRLLTVGGTLRDMKDDGAFASELLVDAKDATKAIAWSFKDVATSTMTETDNIVVDDVCYKLFGTLRPLYANSVQTLALADLGRIGLAVAPPVYRTAKVKAFLVYDGGAKELAPARLEKQPATVFYARGGVEKDHMVLFSRSYVRSLLVALQGIDRATLTGEGKQHYDQFVAGADKVSEKLQRVGLSINGDGPFGIKVRKNRKKGGDWLQLVVMFDEE